MREAEKLLRAEEGDASWAGGGWPVMQPLAKPSACFCFPWVFCWPLPAIATPHCKNRLLLLLKLKTFATPIVKLARLFSIVDSRMYFLTTFSLLILAGVVLLAFVLCGLPLCCFRVYMWSWRCWPFFWPTDLYERILYLGHLFTVLAHKTPNAGPWDENFGLVCVYTL